MIDRNELRKIARARLNDAEVLYRNKRYDGAVYICGYALEVVLKQRICKSLKWKEFPETRSDFKSRQSFKTHDLDVLLLLSGIEEKIKDKYLADWSIVASWDPEVRYKPIGTVNKKDTEQMILATKNLLKVI
jgi:HEPN domain-containing protein